MAKTKVSAGGAGVYSETVYEGSNNTQTESTSDNFSVKCGIDADKDRVIDGGYWEINEDHVALGPYIYLGIMASAPADPQKGYFYYNSTDDKLYIYKSSWEEVATGAGGETNTGANVGADGVGVYDGKSGSELQFRNVAPASSKITVTLNSKDIDVDVSEGNLTHNNLGGIGASDHHAKYLDAEAVSAMGAKADANPLNHDKYTDAEVESIISTECGAGQIIDNDIDSLISAHAGNADAHHARDHSIDSTDDHDGVSGAVEDNFISFDSNGLPKDSGSKAADFQAAGSYYTQAETDSAIDTDIATHAGDDDAHHTPYTDSDAEAVITAELVDGQSIDNAIDSLISAQAGDDDAHHTPYTDAKVNIVINDQLDPGGTIDTGIISKISTHSSDDDAHHAKYTDAEAVAAMAGLYYTQAQVDALLAAAGGATIHPCLSQAGSGFSITSDYGPCYGVASSDTNAYTQWEFRVPVAGTYQIQVRLKTSAAKSPLHLKLFAGAWADGEARNSWNEINSVDWDFNTGANTMEHENYTTTELELEAGDSVGVFFRKDADDGAGTTLIYNCVLEIQ